MTLDDMTAKQPETAAAPARQGEAVTLELDVTELHVHAAKYDKAREGFEVCLSGRAWSKVPITGPRKPGALTRDLYFVIRQIEELSQWETYSRLEQWKASLHFRMDAGGAALVQDEGVSLLIDCASFQHLLALVHAKDLAVLRVSIETDLWESANAYVIPDEPQKCFGLGFISGMTVQTKSCVLKHVQADDANPGDNKPATVVEQHLATIIKRLGWITAGLIALAMVLAFRLH